MKAKILALALIAGSLAAFTPAANMLGGDLTVSTKASKIEWVGKKVTGQHSGEIMLKSGSVTVDGEKLTGGSFDIDMTTIKVTDMEGEYAQKLEGHLNSPDFFDTGKHNTAHFEITKVAKMKADKAGNNTEITGKLTIKGITHEQTFPAKVEIKDHKLAAYADFSIDRTKYEIKYGSGSFFEGLGDNMINDEFGIKLSLAAAH